MAGLRWDSRSFDAPPRGLPPPNAAWIKGSNGGSVNSVLIVMCLALRVCQQSVCGLVTYKVGRGEAPRPPSLPLWVPGRLLLLNYPWCARWSLLSPHHSWGNQQTKCLSDWPGVTQLRSGGSQDWMQPACPGPACALLAAALSRLIISGSASVTAFLGHKSFLEAPRLRSSPPHLHWGLRSYGCLSRSKPAQLPLMTWHLGMPQG